MEIIRAEIKILLLIKASFNINNGARYVYVHMFI